MKKELSEKLRLLHERCHHASGNFSQAQSSEKSFTDLLNEIEILLHQFYICVEKESHFERDIRKLRNSIFFFLNILSPKHPLNCSEPIQAMINSMEDFIDRIDRCFAQHYGDNDLLSKRRVVVFQQELVSFLTWDEATLRENAAITLDLLKSILSDRMEQNPTYGEQKAVRKFMGEIMQGWHHRCQHPYLSGIDTKLILLDFYENRYLGMLFEKVQLNIGKVEPAERTSAIDSLKEYLLKLKEISRRMGIRKNRVIGLLEWLISTPKSSEETSHNGLHSLNEIKTCETNIEKITCNLSADQLALILRAMDDSRLVGAKSMNAVFRNLIPFMRTARKEHLSFGAVRSKAYSPEEKDRQVTLSMLEKMIEKIKNY